MFLETVLWLILFKSSAFDALMPDHSGVICSGSIGVKHQDSQNSFLAFLNAPTSALDQFDVS